MKFLQSLAVAPGSSPRLADIDPSNTHGLTKSSAEPLHTRNVERLSKLSELLWADNRYAILVVLQGMDTSGKDGTIRNVMTGINPRDCRVVNFRRPTEAELEHDFLWRVHAACPRRGEIGVFNRSHYEDVLVVRVHNLVPQDQWELRYDHINDFEKLLHESGTRILKCFLHISKDEQKERLEARLADPVKNWKFEAGDIHERKHWDEYQRAYEAVLERCSTDVAPWYVIPANKKWFRNLAVSSLLVELLESLDLKPPKPHADLSQLKIE
ncbi:MAG TPA: polyphosphate kinase 2 family protein [Phycisphaerales bacterium]|nr:polyphosphate kinase 2 family protein [Phycisphaerales bacterium]